MTEGDIELGGKKVKMQKLIYKWAHEVCRKVIEARGHGVPKGQVMNTVTQILTP